MRTPISTRKKNAVVRDRLVGMTYRALADKHGIHHSTVGKILVKAGVVNDKTVTQNMIRRYKEIAMAYVKGDSLVDIGRTFQIKKCGIYTALYWIEGEIGRDIPRRRAW